MMLSIRCPAASIERPASQPNSKPGPGSVTAAGATLPVTEAAGPSGAPGKPRFAPARATGKIRRWRADGGRAKVGVNRELLREVAMLRTRLLVAATALVASTTLLAGAALAQDRWDGADDLRPTRSPATAARGAVVAKDYDGGQPTGRARPRRPGDHPGRRAEADRHRLLRRDDEGHAAGGGGARQRQGLDRRPDRGQHRRPDHLHRQLHHPGRRTASCSPPTTRSPSRRC